MLNYYLRQTDPIQAMQPVLMQDQFPALVQKFLLSKIPTAHQRMLVLLPFFSRRILEHHIDLFNRLTFYFHFTHNISFHNQYTYYTTLFAKCQAKFAKCLRIETPSINTITEFSTINALSFHCNATHSHSSVPTNDA